MKSNTLINKILEIIDEDVPELTELERYVYKSVKIKKKPYKVLANELNINVAHIQRILLRARIKCLIYIEEKNKIPLKISGKYESIVKIEFNKFGIKIPAFKVIDTGASKENIEARIELLIKNHLKVKFIKTTLMKTITLLLFIFMPLAAFSQYKYKQGEKEYILSIKNIPSDFLARMGFNDKWYYITKDSVYINVQTGTYYTITIYHIVKQYTYSGKTIIGYKTTTACPFYETINNIDSTSMTIHLNKTLKREK